jgi:hypothetical protein
MAHIRRLRYGLPERERPPETKEVPIEIRRGFHYGLPEYALPVGYSPDCLNVIPTIDDVGITPRDGLDFFSTYTGMPQPEAINMLYDIRGTPVLMALSGTSIHYYPYSNPSWSALTELGTPLSHTTTAHSEIIQANSTSTAYGIVLNATNSPKYSTVEQDTQHWSDLTQIFSITSVAYTGTQSDERVVFANLTSLDVPHPRRLVWSVRGNPLDYTIALGAGFADLTEMNGSIMRIVPDTQGFLILGTNEIWRARPRRDIYAYDFIVISREMGCPFPNTAVATPFGVVFVGSDYEVYALLGSQLRPLGIAEDSKEASRVRRYIKQNLTDPNFVWGMYDYNTKRYHLQFGPDDGLTYNFSSDAWWPHEFGFDAAWRGCMIIDPPDVSDLGLSWDKQTLNWDRLNNIWNDEGVLRPATEGAYPLLAAAGGFPLRWRPEIISDTSHVINNHWRSPRLSANGRRYNYDGTWVEFSSATASSMTVTHQFDDRAHVQSRSLQSSRLSTAWAPTHGVGRAVSIKVELNPRWKPQLTAMTAGLRIHSGKGGGR